MPDLPLYTGSCHCGRVRYQVRADLSKPVIACNCSICSRSGHLLAFVPATDFTLLTSEDALTDYVFGPKRIHHLFCKTCGVRSFAKGAMPDGTEMRAINVRCLEEVDVDPLPIHRYDGKSIPLPPG